MPSGRRAFHSKERRALTLFELLLTVVIIGILFALIIPQLNTGAADQLQAAAQIVASDIEYARSLAVTNDTKYRFTFEPDSDRYYLEHSGTNSLFDVLPPSAFRLNTDPPDRQTTDLASLPLMGPRIHLAAVYSVGTTTVDVLTLEFNPLGATTRTQQTVVWLACGSGEGQRFLPLHINPTTGLVEIGSLTTELPPTTE